MSSTIYNHRSLQPQGPPAPGPAQGHNPARLNDSIEVFRQEFELAQGDITVLRAQRDDFENKVNAQVNELNLIKQSLYELENQHSRVKQQYEEEVGRLRAELHSARQQSQQAAAAQAAAVNAQQQTTGQAPLPGLGSAAPPMPLPISTSGGPPAGGLPPAHSAGGLPPPNTAAAGPGGPPPGGPGMGMGAPYGEGFYRGGERDQRERERERAAGGGDRAERERAIEREREREREARERDREREAKRVKTERTKTERLDYTPGPTHKPYGEAGPSASSSSTALVPASGSSVPGPANNANAFLDDLDVANVPADLKKEGSDWFAVFNPKVKRQLDVTLVHTLAHESVVCCVRFSADGKFLATGCNRSAQIYDTKTGAKTCVLIDEHASSQGDLYIRSVCFSPDGKYLATGAEDKQIRIWDIAKKRIRRVFEGHQQEIYSLAFSHDGRLIVSGSGDKTARIWDMENGSQKVLEIMEPEGIDAGVTSVAMSADSRLVAAGSLDTIVRIWDVATGNLVERLRGHRDSVYSVAFTPDGKGLVSGSLDKTLKHWDITPLTRAGAKREPLPPVTPVGASSPSTSNGGGAVVAGGRGATAMKEGGERGSGCTLNFTGHKDYVLSVAVSHDGRWVVSGSKDRGVQFWEQQSAQVQLMLQGHKNSVISIDLSPQGGILATGSGDWQARLWSYTLV